MAQAIDAAALDRVFDGHTAYAWTEAPVSEADLRALYDLVKLCPTSANSSPARFVFCTSRDARDRLAECADGGNRDRIRAAPVTVIVGRDLQFYERLPELFPQADARSWFAGNQPKIVETATRNASLQGAYLILAARALGYDTGPMSGFDKAKVDAAFWGGMTVETDFLCSIGIGDPASFNPRNPRLAFEDAARIL